MKKTIYILAFVILGIFLQFLIHAGIEIWYINRLLENFAKYGLGFSWNFWFIIHYFFTILLFIIGVIFGFWQGQLWWEAIYEKKKRGNKVVIGGTFDYFHKGHKTLIKKAFSLGKVTIGLTSDEMANRIKRREVAPFYERKGKLVQYIRSRFDDKKIDIIQIEDKFGPTLEKDFDHIVVSPETYETAELINKKREAKEKDPINVVQIDFVLAEDGKPISATRIAQGEIDREGNLINK